MLVTGRVGSLLDGHLFTEIITTIWGIVRRKLFGVVRKFSEHWTERFAVACSPEKSNG